MLFPFFPRRPHRFSRPKSCAGLPADLDARRAGLGGLSNTGFGLPPRMADTDECGDLAFFWMADVMEMHSDMTSETGSTATETGRLLYLMRGGVVIEIAIGIGVEGVLGSMFDSPEVGRSIAMLEGASRFIVRRPNSEGRPGSSANSRRTSRHRGLESRAVGEGYVGVGVDVDVGYL